jgi:hypothetical protein
VSTAEHGAKQGAKVKAGYFLASGQRVPGVTTVLGVIGKPALVKWANNLGLQGIDSTKYVDALAAIGTLAHKMILTDLRGGDVKAVTDEVEFKETVSRAENCFLSYLNWKGGKTIEPILLEQAFVSEANRFGGTLDFYGKIDGRLTIADYKTGKGIYPDHFYQLAAYSRLLVENGFSLPQDYMVLNIPRAESESYDSKTKTDLSNEWEIFYAALVIYTRSKDKD